jgi:hypothetical protein
VSAGVTVAEALAKLRAGGGGAPTTTVAGPLSRGAMPPAPAARAVSGLAAIVAAVGRRRPRASVPGHGWRRVTGWKAIAVGLVVTPLVLAAVMLGADVLGLRGGAHNPATGASQPALAGVGDPAGAPLDPRDGRSNHAATSTSTTATSAPTTSGGQGGGGASGGAAASAPAGHRANPATASTSGGTRAVGGSSSTTTSTSPTTTSTSATTTTPAPSPVAAWRAQDGWSLQAMQNDVAAVQGAAPTPAGDYTAVVALWQQLATDVATAQGLPAIPDTATDTKWSVALGELATATSDWLASLSSTAPPGGTIADQHTFDAGTGQFGQGVTDLTAVATAVAAA